LGRIKKDIYLFLDAYLNYYFIRVGDANLLKHGLKKYNRLVRFNIAVLLLMDFMIIGTMSLTNRFV
jgi:hypothetical protein